MSHPPRFCAKLIVVVVILTFLPGHHVTETYDVTVGAETKPAPVEKGFEPATFRPPQQSGHWKIRRESSENIVLPSPLPQRSSNVTVMTPVRPHNVNGDSAAIFCDWERFNVSCGSDEVLIVSRARYGRMNLNRCVTKDYGHVGCGDDVTIHFERTCSARQSCDMSVISLQEVMVSCPREFKAYVEVSYYCIAVLPVVEPTTATTEEGRPPPDQRIEQQSHHFPPQTICPTLDISNGRTNLGNLKEKTKRQSLTSMSSSILLFSAYGGILSSYVWLKAFKSGVHKEPCPWSLSAAPYQRINFTLIDFSLPPGDKQCAPNEQPESSTLNGRRRQENQGCQESLFNESNNMRDCYTYVIFSERDSPEQEDGSLQNYPVFFEEDFPNDENEDDDEWKRSSVLTAPPHVMNYDPKIVNSEEKFKQKDPLKKHRWHAGSEISGRFGSRFHRICRQDRRESLVYSSTTNKVSVVLVAGRKRLDEHGHFLIKYQVYGCSPLEPPENSWIEYLTLNKAVVICNSTNRSTLFLCSSTQWIGQTVRCPPPTMERTKATEGWSNHQSRSGNDTEIFFGILFVIALGVVVGIIVGIFLLVSVLVYQRKFPIGKLKRRRSTYRTSAELDLVSSAASGFLDDEAVAESVLSNQHVHHLPQGCRLQRFQNCYNDQQYHQHQQRQQQHCLHHQVLHRQFGRHDLDSEKPDQHSSNSESRMVDEVRSCCHHGQYHTQPCTLVATTGSVTDGSDIGGQYHHVHFQPFLKDQTFQQHYRVATMPTQIDSCYLHHPHQLYGSGSNAGIQYGDENEDATTELKKAKLRDPSDLVRSTLQTMDKTAANCTKEQTVDSKSRIDCQSGKIAGSG